jgi:hypothetical protein
MTNYCEDVQILSFIFPLQIWTINEDLQVANILNLKIPQSQALEALESTSTGKAHAYRAVVRPGTTFVRSTQVTFMKGPIYNSKRSRRKHRETTKKSHTQRLRSFHLRRGEPLLHRHHLHHHLHPFTSPPP